MKKIKLRHQKISDARRFYEILSNPNFIYFQAKPKSIEDEKTFLRENASKRKKKIEYNYAIILENEVVGACGIRIKQNMPHIGEIGYFMDETYWGKGLASKAVKLLEKIALKELCLKRLEIIIMQKNAASKQVAIKNKYKKEGSLSKAILNRGKYEDAFLYAKVK